MLKRFLVAEWMAFAVLFGVLVGVTNSADTPRQPPHNVSGDPAGVQVPVLDPLPGETVNLILNAEKVADQVGEDYQDWGVKALNGPAAWAKGLTGKNVKVAVLDTGWAKNHRDLKDGVKGSRDFTNSSTGDNDISGHGSHCLGIVGARKNGWGTVGLAYDAELYSGKVMNDRGQGRVDHIRDGILHSVNVWKVDVISLSLGGAGTDDFIPQGLRAAEAEGVIVLAATGNDGNGRPVNFPAAYPFPIAVGAVDVGLRLANFSCTGDKVEGVAPGVNVRAPYPGAGDGLFADLSGTSMATPYMAAVAALWVQANPDVPKKDRPAKFREWLKENAKDLGRAGRDPQFGWGLPDCSKLQAAVPQPPQPPVKPGDGILIDESDLNPKGLEKLKKGGFGRFKIELMPVEGPKQEARRLSLDGILSEVKGGKTLVVFVKVPADLGKHPGGVVMADPPAELPAGVYEAKLVEKVGLTPVE